MSVLRKESLAPVRLGIWVRGVRKSDEEGQKMWDMQNDQTADYGDIAVGWQHVYPVNDWVEHKLIGMDCICEPGIDWDGLVVVHNAADGR